MPRREPDDAPDPPGLGRPGLRSVLRSELRSGLRSPPARPRPDGPLRSGRRLELDAGFAPRAVDFDRAGWVVPRGDGFPRSSGRAPRAAGLAPRAGGFAVREVDEVVRDADFPPRPARLRGPRLRLGAAGSGLPAASDRLATPTAGCAAARGATGRRPALASARFAALAAARASFGHVPTIPTGGLTGVGAGRRAYRIEPPHRRRDEGAPMTMPLRSRNPGGDLLSQGAAPQVPSARAVFTSVFGMGTGVSPPQLPPET